MSERVAQATEAAARLEAALRRVIVGKDDKVRLALVPLLCRGHVLIEDVPGVGKTTLARALAGSIRGSFQRVQFTPDLLPLDLTGASIFNQKTREFDFQPGPVFANILLADEINRATPRTQSALLECMAEGQVTVDGVTRRLPEPFFVLATLNPSEMSGTFELPETQLDRFMLRLSLGYPSESEEVQIFERQAQRHPLEDLEPVLDLEEVEQLRAAAGAVHVEDSVKLYAAQVVRATRTHEDVRLGASPRGTLGLIRAAQALALLQGEDFVAPATVQSLAPAVLAHRLTLTPQATLRGVRGEDVVQAVLGAVPVPIEGAGGGVASG